MQTSEFMLLALNHQRKAIGLPRATKHNPRKITPEVIQRVTVEVWSKYPGAFTNPNFELGELTVALVRKEVEQRLLDIKRGVTPVQGSVPDYHF